MSKREKILSLTLLSVMVVAAFYVVYVYLARMAGLAHSDKRERSLATIEKTEDWKKYRNDKFGFSLNYPNEWASPTEEETKNNDKSYIFKVALGTEEGQREASVDGFYVFIYPTDVCLGGTAAPGAPGKSYNVHDAKNLAEFIASQAKKSSICQSKRISVKGDMLQEQVNIYQLTGADYNYVIIPFINKGSKTSEKFKNQWVNALRTFLIDSPKLKKPDTQEAGMKKPSVVFAILKQNRPQVRW